MKKNHTWFELYPHNHQATNLSMAGGGVKLLSILLLIAAIPFTLAIILTCLRLTLAGGPAMAMMYLVDELDDELWTALFLWGAVAVCRYAACVLQCKARILGELWEQETVQNTETQAALPAKEQNV